MEVQKISYSIYKVPLYASQSGTFQPVKWHFTERNSTSYDEQTDGLWNWGVDVYRLFLFVCKKFRLVYFKRKVLEKCLFFVYIHYLCPLFKMECYE